MAKKNVQPANEEVEVIAPDTAEVTPEQIQNYSVKIMVDGKAN